MQIEIVEYIDIVDKKWFSICEERSRLLDGSSCFKELFSLIADLDMYAEILFLRQEIDDLLGEMVDIHHDVCASVGFQAVNEMLQKGFVSYGDQCLWHRICQGLEACAKSCSKY